MAVICLGGLFAVSRFHVTETHPPAQVVTQKVTTRDEGLQSTIATPTKPIQVAKKNLLPKKAAEPLPPPQKPTSPTPATDLPPARTGAKEARSAEPANETKPPTMTARDWFEKGRALDDDSDGEMKAYAEALEIDQKFAPAYYRLGAIHFRRGEYDLADKAFGQFLANATDEEKRFYDIHVFYSPDEAEELIPEEGEKEDTKKEKAPAAETEVLAEKAEVEQEEELKTVVRFTSLRGHIRIPVLLNGTTEANLMLDTGAGVTLLSRELAGRLGIEPRRSARLIHLKTVGQDIEVPVVKLDSLRFGDIAKRDFPVAVSELNLGDKSFDGILGMDFLGGYDIRINHAEQKILLSVKTRPIDP